MADTMQVSSRRFVREFPRMRALASKGKEIDVATKSRRFSFRALKAQRPALLGLTKGAMRIVGKPADLYCSGEAWEADR
jgi:hypothetical protein